jgi:predicted HicB family RNase H-like nuclease
MSYKGLTARIEFFEDDKVFVGRLNEIEGIVTFDRETVDELRKGFVKR